MAGTGIHPDLRSLLGQRKESEGMRDLWSRAQHRTQQLNANPHLRASFPSPLPLVVNPISSNSPRVLLKRRKDIDTNLSRDKYYTSVTQRSQKNGALSPEYDALVREFVPLPKLYDSPSVLSKREYRKGNIDAWRKQVIKVVPPRPDYSVKSHVPPVEWLPDYEHNILQGSDPQFYEAKQGAPPRHYMVCPEWLSENTNYKTGPAYRSNIVFG